MRGLLQVTFVAAVFFAFHRIWGATIFNQPGSGKSPLMYGLYAGVAACLVIGLWQQVRDIRLALRQAGELERGVRRGAWCEIAWRCGLGGLITALFVIRFFRRPDGLGLEFLDESPHYQEHLAWHATQPLSDSLLLLSLVATNGPAPLPAGKTWSQRLLGAIGNGVGLAAASVWLGILLMESLLIPDLVHTAIRGMELSEPVVFLGHRLTEDRVPDPCIPLFHRMGISFLAGCVGLAAIRSLARFWDAGFRWRLVPLALFVAAAALQIHLVGWALSGGAREASQHLWDNRPPVWALRNVLGAFLLIIVVTALAQRWRMSDEASSCRPLLTWRTPRHYYPHEWGTLLILLPAVQLYYAVKDLDWTLTSISEWLAASLVEPGSILHLALAATAVVGLYRWFRGRDVAMRSEIASVNLSKELTTWSCLLLAAVLAIPALALTFFAGWMVVGAWPNR